METLKESMLKTLGELDKDKFRIFKWYLKRLEGLKPIPEYLLEDTDTVQTVDLIRQTYSRKEVHIVMENVLKRMKREDLLERFLTIHNVHEESAMETLKALMLETLERLDTEHFESLKFYLRQPSILDGSKPIPMSRLEKADRMDTVDLITLNYSSKAVCIMVNLLGEIKRSELREKFYKLHKVHEESTIETLKEPTMEDHIMEILDELDQNAFIRFKWFLRQPVKLEGLQPIPKDADRRKTVGLIVQDPSKAACIMVKVLQKIQMVVLKMRFLELSNVHEESIHTLEDSLEDSREERILEALDSMDKTEFGEFKRRLEGIPWKELDEANRMDTVDLIMQYFPKDAEQIVVNVLQKIDMDYIALQMFPDIKGSNKKKRKRSHEELNDDSDASTSTIPRTWLSVSERWRPKLEKLVNMDDSKVKKVESLVYVKEFRIAEGSNGVEVFLGLRKDGTEVAVKRMSKTCNLYNVLKNDELYLRLPGLDDPSIVRYIDFVEDEDYGYLVLQLCECTLEEYITKPPEQERKPLTPPETLAKQVLNSLRILHSQDSNILHRDIKPQNVLIDIQGRARLADFGISRQIEQGRKTHHTNVAGTECWMAKETLDKSKADYKRSTDIQVAGMLIHYILSGGHHPFQEDPTKKLECQNNISKGIYFLKRVVDDDVVAKDLVEWMIHGDPEKRPNVEQCLAHPFFWPSTWREEYLGKIGNKEMKVLIPALEQYDKGQFNEWKQKFLKSEEETRKLFEGMDEHEMKKGPDGKKKKKYSDNLVGLLRFIRNLHAHYAEHPARPLINLMEMFPALFGYVYKFAKEQDWNSRPALKEMFDFCPRSAFTS